MINLYNSDCMEALKAMKDNQYDLAIVDPPYGIGDFTDQSEFIKDKNGVPRKSSGIYKKVTWNNSIPDKKYFGEIHRVSKNHIIFGFQFYTKYLWPELKGVIIHDFKNNSFNMSHADCAITNLQKRTTVFRYLWAGFQKDFKEVHDKNRIHSCEKPVSLYKWLLKNYAKEGDKILDTHGGSMSIALACHDMKYDLDLYEIDKDYFEAGVKRYNNHIRQLQLF